MAGYGVERALPAVGAAPLLDRPAIERLEPLFGSRGLTSTNFTDVFEKKLRTKFLEALKQVLIHVEDMLPEIADLELRGRGGVATGGELQERNRFLQRMGTAGEPLKVPAIGLSHGYQSTIAWIADLMGHLLLAHADGRPFSPQRARGLVLVDELDLYLHPTWQVRLIHALRTAFPRLQFVVTTHSPLLLAALDPHHDHIVRLDFDATSGEVVRVDTGGDPRLMSGTELYARYFQVTETYVTPEGRELRAYEELATNPYRSDEEDRQVQGLRRQLQAAGVDVPLEPVPRERP